jgi:hypothetical protein
MDNERRRSVNSGANDTNMVAVKAVYSPFLYIDFIVKKTF